MRIKSKSNNERPDPNSPTQKGSQQFSFNFRNQLVRAIDGGSTITMKYDPLGRRIEKSGTGNTIRFYYAGNQVIEERNGSDLVLKQYIYGNGIDELLRLDFYSGATSTPYYTHTNDIGSTTAITDANGALVERVSYDNFGLPSFSDASGHPIASSSIGNNILFQGREYDLELNLYNYRARYYDPIMGRFLQTDPVGYKDSMNLYQGMGMNPVNIVDPLGLYNEDFHYYIIYFLMRARGWNAEEAEMVAGFSNYVDESDVSRPDNLLLIAKKGLVHRKDNPIYYFHFHGWWGGGNVERNNFYVRAMMENAIKPFTIISQDGNLIQSRDKDDFARLGITLHIYADTWAHEGHESPVGHLMEGDSYWAEKDWRSTYDEKILASNENSVKALDAAKNIFESLPVSNNINSKKMTWGQIESLLRIVFEPIVYANIDVKIVNGIVEDRLFELFGNNYSVKHYSGNKFKQMDQYYRTLLS